MCLKSRIFCARVSYIDKITENIMCIKNKRFSLVKILHILYPKERIFFNPKSKMKTIETVEKPIKKFSL